MRIQTSFALLMLALPSRILADDAAGNGEKPFQPPPYQVLRFDENYSYLADASRQGDWFDPIKYIPLGTNNPNMYLSLGGELRERFEAMHNPDFGIPGSHDAYW